MRGFFNLILGVLMAGAVAWYITYQINEPFLCKPHPIVEKRVNYKSCWPGVSIPKDSWLDGYSPVSDKIRKYKKGVEEEDNE